MIINKRLVELKGVVEYEIVLDEANLFTYHECDCDEEIELFDYRRFQNLSEFNKAISNETIEEIKEEYSNDYSNVKEVIVTNIIFNSNSQEKDVSSRISVSENGIFGWATVEIKNEDIEHRLLSNLEQVKRIIDNTLEEYPIAFRRE